MNHLKTRLQKLEAASGGFPFTGVFRIIQNGALKPDQKQQIAEAKAAGNYVIIRQIVET